MEKIGLKPRQGCNRKRTPDPKGGLFVPRIVLFFHSKLIQIFPYNPGILRKNAFCTRPIKISHCQLFLSEECNYIYIISFELPICIRTKEALLLTTKLNTIKFIIVAGRGLEWCGFSELGPANRIYGWIK